MNNKFQSNVEHFSLLSNLSSNIISIQKKNQRYTEYYGEENLFGIKEIQKKRPKFSRMT